MKLQLRTVRHPTPRPAEDDEEGERLVGWVKRALAQGSAPPVAATLRPERTDLVPLGPVAQAKIQIPRFVAALTRSTIDEASLPYAVATIGVVQARRRNAKDTPPTPMAVVFVEWPDNRWWYWKALIDSDGLSLREGTEVVTRAVDGDPLPALFGRWWSLARRGNLSIHLSRADRPEASQIVH